VKELKELGVAGSATLKEQNKQDFFIQWHLTERCNLRCRHCYQTDRGSGELPRAEIREVADEVSELLEDWAETYGIVFSPSFTITGGEPFLRADLFECVSELEGRGFELYLLSNGTLIDREKAKLLKEHGFRGVQISIEGPEPVHDAIRGHGSFRKAMAGAAQVISAGIPVTLNVTLSKLNSDYLGDLARLASGAGARLGLSRLVPSGRGKALADAMLSPLELRDLYRKAFALEKEGLEIVTGDPIASQMKAQSDGDHSSGESLSHLPAGGCAAGVSGLTLLPDGTITPCRRLPIPLGNVRKDSLREVWSLSPVLARLRQRAAYSGKCRICSRWSGCRGCRAVAYAMSEGRGEDDYLADDPQCFMEESE